MTLSSEAVELFSEHHGIHFSLQGLAQEWGVAGAAAERFIRDGRFSFRVKHHQIGRSPFFQGDGGSPISLRGASLQARTTVCQDIFQVPPDTGK